MNTKLLLSTIAGGISYFILGFLTYGILLSNFFTPPEGINKEPMVMWAMVVSCLIFAFLIALVAQRWAGVKTFRGGAVTGAIIGALLSGSVNFGMFSMYNFISMNTLWLDIIVTAVNSAITGGVIVLVLRSGVKNG